MCTEYVEIKIWDSGAAFDLEQKIKDMSEKINPEASGGRGLKLMKDIADSCSVIRERLMDGTVCRSSKIISPCIDDRK